MHLRWLLAAIVAFCIPCTPASTSVHDEQYGCLWWANGSPYFYENRRVSNDDIPDDYPGEDEVLCLHTGRYGLAIDTLNLSRLKFGQFDALVPYATDLLEVDETIRTFPESRLSIEVHVGNRVYTCVGRERPSDRTQFPVQFIEYGRYFQHISINGLIMKAGRFRRLDADCRLEIASWPGALQLNLFVDGDKVSPDRIVLRAGGLVSGAIVRDEGESRVGLTVVDIDPPTSPHEVNVASKDGNQIDVAYSEAQRAHIVRIRDPDWTNQSGTYYPEEHLDRLDTWKFSLVNESDQAKVFRLRFDTTPRNMTGFTPMILDDQGRPTGLPVQTSKNWHKGETAVRYQGSWVHGSTQIEVPPNSQNEFQYAITYARWGGVPAASHAQLSLVGWGHNMFWDQSAVGSFGESICFEPGRTQRRSFITDVRPLMVYDSNGKEWGWTGNTGGGDFLVYHDARGDYVPMTKTRGRYLSYGPNLTRITYDELSLDHSIAASYTIRVARADDYLRCFVALRYDVLKPIEFSRLAFAQMPADYYNNISNRKMAIGNVDGLTSEWSVTNGRFAYAHRPIPLAGDQPWVSLHDVPQNADTTQATRGFIIRKWDAVLGSEVCEQPHLSTFLTAMNRDDAKAVAEVSAPADIRRLHQGDYVELELELVVFPSRRERYYGPNQSLIEALDSNANTWKMVHREAAGNNLNVRTSEGELIAAYPIEVRATEDCRAQFQVAGGVGYVPITISGLEKIGTPRLFFLKDGQETEVDQSVNGNDFWQTDFDDSSGTWSITYNVNLDSVELVTLRFQMDGID